LHEETEFGELAFQLFEAAVEVRIDTVGKLAVESLDRVEGISIA
jgi:hypothetical protein